MGKPVKDLTGQKFERLAVIIRAGSNIYKKATWVCRCDCGKEVVVIGSALLKKTTRSCGCLKNEETGARRRTHGATVGRKRTKEYNSWKGMRERCYSLSHKQYKDYGGRGIKVCGRWLESFENFLEDMGPIPGPGYSIERRDNDGDYCPTNCYWATRKEQNNNTHKNVMVDHNGKVKTLAQAAEESGIPYRTILARINRGWPFDQLFTPSDPHRKRVCPRPYKKPLSQISSD
jgi:hypothetical protein